MGSPTLICPFCRDTDFDDTGLKVHLTEGYCEVFALVTGPARTARLTPTPPAPADDASGAEAMGIPGLDFQPPRDRTPNGYTRVEAYMGQGHVVVMGYPTDESHSCDALGCGSTGAHVIARLPLPARDDAVEEARRAFYEAARAYVEAKVEGTPHGCTYIDVLRAHEALVAAERDAALRRAHGGPPERSDGGHEAQGRGGA